MHYLNAIQRVLVLFVNHLSIIHCIHKYSTLLVRNYDISENQEIFVGSSKYHEHEFYRKLEISNKNSSIIKKNCFDGYFDNLYQRFKTFEGI